MNDESPLTTPSSAATPTGAAPPASIYQLVVPPHLDATSSPAVNDFVAIVRILNDFDEEVIGTKELAWEPDEILPSWRDPQRPKQAVIARVGGRIVGCALCEAETVGAEEAWITIRVEPAFRGRGIGTSLLDVICRVARGRGHTVAQAYFLTAVPDPGSADSAGNEAGGRLPAPTGFGSVPLDNPGTRFALANAFTLEQVERASRLPLPVDAEWLASLAATAAATAGDDYRTVSWVGPAPAHWLDDIAHLVSRMTTDYPSAALTITEDVWDAERVRAFDELESASPRTALASAVEHIPTGRLVGFTTLSVPPRRERAVSQEDTIVLSEHRGHRLGMLLKCTNLQLLAELHPGHPAITTFNAEENRHMLAVNEELGFVAVGYEGAWKRML